MVRVCHLITEVDLGGADRGLTNLVRSSDPRRFSHAVISMTKIGSLGKQVAAEHVVYDLGMRRGVPSPTAFFRLVRILRRLNPHVLHSWMYHANLMGLLAAWMAGVPRVIWNIHASNLDFTYYRRLTRSVVKFGALLSRFADRIVVVADRGKTAHQAYGYADTRMVVIPNGFDLDLFKPDPTAYAAVRRELGFTNDILLIGLIARFDPMKDHETFFKAASLLKDREPRVHFLLAGEGVDPENAQLCCLVRKHGLDSRVHLLGLRSDVQRLLAALNIAALSSAFGEAFPRAIGEAMACEVPCVVTDVGDSARLVGEIGIVVPPRDPSALADAWTRLLAKSEDERRALGRAARERIASHFSQQEITKRYEQLYAEIAANG